MSLNKLTNVTYYITLAFFIFFIISHTQYYDNYLSHVLLEAILLSGVRCFPLNDKNVLFFFFLLSTSLLSFVVVYRDFVFHNFLIIHDRFKKKKRRLNRSLNKVYLWMSFKNNYLFFIHLLILRLFFMLCRI